MTLKEQYKKETNLEVYILDRFTGDFDNTKYVEWLEAKINYTRCCETLPVVVVPKGTLFCGECGNKRELIVETDINSDRVCKNRLCKAK